MAYYYAGSTQNETLPCMYSGFLPSTTDKTDPTLANQMFFWMYVAQDYENAPLVIWLDGGPGLSS